MNKPLMLGLAIFSISGLFLTGINYQTASAGPATEAALILALVTAIDESDQNVRHAKCTATYEKNGNEVSKTKYTNSKGIAVFPLKGYVDGDPITVLCVTPELSGMITITSAPAGDIIEVILRPSR